MRIPNIDDLPFAAPRAEWARLLQADVSTFYRAELRGELRRLKPQSHQAVYTKREILRWLGIEPEPTLPSLSNAITNSYEIDILPRPMSPEVSAREARLAQKQAVDAELTRARTQLAKLRCERDAITVSMRKGELIKKYDAKVALGFLLTGMRQRLMSFACALPPRLAGKTEHEIGRLLDEEVRLALRDVALWPQKMSNPGWSENIDEDLRPLPEAAGNGNGEVEGAAKRERTNAKRRVAYAKKKES